MHEWEDNVKVDLQELGMGGIDWIALVQERELLYAVLKCLSPHNAGIFLNS
jgi:hypothetical protein